MSTYSEEEKYFIVATFYGNSDSHSVTVKKYVERFGPSKKLTADTINKFVAEFEIEHECSANIKERKKRTRKARANYNINKVTDLLEKDSQLTRNEITSKAGLSQSKIGEIIKKDLGIKKHIARRTARTENNIKLVADMLKIRPKMSNIAIGKKLNISNVSVRKIIEEDIPKLQDGSTIQSEIVDTSNKANPVANIDENKPLLTQENKAQEAGPSTSTDNIIKNDLYKNHDRHTCDNINPVADILTESEQDNKAEKADVFKFSGNSLIKEHLSNISKRFMKPGPKKVCVLEDLFVQMIKSNDPKVQNEIAEKIGVPKDKIQFIRQRVGVCSHDLKKKSK